MDEIAALLKDNKWCSRNGKREDKIIHMQYLLERKILGSNFDPWVSFLTNPE